MNAAAASPGVVGVLTGRARSTGYIAPVRYRLVLFDFDGTLADSFPWFLRALDDVGREFRLNRIPPAEVEHMRSLGPRRIMERLGVSWWKVPFLARRMRQRMMADASSIQAFPGVHEMLRRISESGTAMGVVTSNSEHSVRAVLGSSAALLQHWECQSSMFGKSARIRSLLRRTRTSREHALCVGDELRDADAARAAGVDFAAVSWGFATRDALVATGPVMMFDSVGEMADRLTSPGGA